MRRPHQIAVDLVYLTGRRGGTETYARGLYAALGEIAPDFHFVGLTNAHTDSQELDWFPGRLRRLLVSGENRLSWALAEACLVGPAARIIGAELLHCPANFGPTAAILPTVITIHDLLSFRHPDLSGRLSRGVSTLSRAAGRAADRVLTDSQASAADIETFLDLSPTRIDVIPLAAAPVGSSVTNGHRLPEVLATESRVMALTTGNRMPHKNFAGLLQGWARIPGSRRPLLVITGSHSADPLLPLVRTLGLSEDVVLLGWVTPDELEGLYASASLYICASLFEGFGLPVLEAMQRNCPVVASDIPVLREIGGAAVRYVDTTSAEAIAAAVTGLLSDPNELARLRDLGAKQASLFTWAHTAEMTAESFRRVLADRRRT